MQEVKVCRKFINREGSCYGLRVKNNKRVMYEKGSSGVRGENEEGQMKEA